MKFDREFFDAGLYRVNTRCIKWDEMRAECGNNDVLPLWVADMDFACHPAIQQAVLARAAHPTYGYTMVADDDFDAMIGFWERRHHIRYKREWLHLLPCVVTGLKTAMLAATNPGDPVIVLSPCYGPFRFSVEATGRTLVDIPLICTEGRYTLNLPAIEQAMADGAKALLFCSPHNPVGRLWKREELQAICELCERYGVLLVSDEIHADFALNGTFIPVLSLRKTNTIALTAASKTFNLAGLQQATAICADEALRKAFVHQLEAAGVESGNIFGLEATRAAYLYGDEWLDGLLKYIRFNRDVMENMVAERLPKAIVTPLEATYLAWIDLSAYGFTSEELQAATIREGVRFTDGPFFGQGGEAHLRVNLGCPTEMVLTGIYRLSEAVKKLEEERK